MFSPAYQSLTDHFDNLGIRYETDDNNERLFARFGGKGLSTDVVCDVGEHILQVFARPTFQVPAGARQQISELVCRANYGLKVGKLEFDMNDGELRFQASTCLTDERDVSDRMIAVLIGGAFFVLERYIPAVMACVYGNEAPKDAIRLAEAG